MLTLKNISEMLDGEWIVPPKDLEVVVPRFAMYQMEIERKDRSTVFIAMDSETWLRGTKNTGVYSQWVDSHTTVPNFEEKLMAVIVQRKIEGLSPEIAQFQVKDSYAAMEVLFRYEEANFVGRKIGITGTVGKTTTKNLISTMLAVHNSVHVTNGNHNSRTAIKMDVLNNSQKEFTVLEMAMSSLYYGPEKVGIVREVPLDLAIITQVGFGQKGTDEQKTADFKTRICYGLKDNQPALINRDITNYEQVEHLANRYTENILTYGFHANADFHGIEENNELSITYNGSTLLQINTLGLDRGILSNIMAAVAGYSLLVGDLTNQVIDTLLSNVSELVTYTEQNLTIADNKVKIIDDTKNAEFLSMKNFIDYASHYQSAKKIMIVGRIINLDHLTDYGHRKLVEELNKSSFDEIYFYGEMMGPFSSLVDTEKFRGHYENIDTLIQALAPTIDQETTIFIKGSRRNSKIHLISNALIHSLDYYYHQQNHFTMTGDHQLTSAYQERGLGNLLVVLEVLEALAQGKLKLTQTIEITKELVNDPSVFKVGLRKNEKYPLGELLLLSVIRNAPDALINLAEWYYGSNAQAMTGLKTRAKKIGLNTQAVTNITGRKNKFKQKVYLQDLEKLADEFLKLPLEILSLLNQQRIFFKGKVFQKTLPIGVKGITLGELCFGNNDSCGMIFYEVNHERKAISYINSPNTIFASHKVENTIRLQRHELKQQPEILRIHLNNSKINILGDTYFGEMYTKRRQKRGIEDALTKYGYHHSFEKIGELFGKDTFNILNFEAVFNEGKASALAEVKPFLLDAESNPTITEVKDRNFDLVTLANNHGMDFGSEALNHTKKVFEDNGIVTIGGGKDVEESRKIIEFEYQDKIYAFFNGYWYRKPSETMFDFYSMVNKTGVNCLDSVILDDISNYKAAHPDVKVIVSAHWGVDFKPIHPMQKQSADLLTLAGADLIIGHGPHTLQPVKQVNDGVVVYSIGNGVFNSNGEYEKHGALPYGMVAQLDLSKDLVELMPFHANNLKTFWQPELVDEQIYQELHAYFDEHLKIDGDQIRYSF